MKNPVCTKIKLSPIINNSMKNMKYYFSKFFYEMHKRTHVYIYRIVYVPYIASKDTIYYKYH